MGQQNGHHRAFRQLSTSAAPFHGPLTAQLQRMDGRFASLPMMAAMFPHPWKETDQLALAATFTHMKEPMIGFLGARLAAALYLQELSFRSPCLGKIKVGDTKKDELL